MNKFITSIILIISALGLSITYTRANYNIYKQTDIDIQEYKNALDQADELKNLQNRLTEQFDSIPIETRDKLEKLLPRNIDNVRLTIEINTIANNNNVEISALSFATNTPETETPESPGIESGPQAPRPTAGIQVSNRGQFSSVDMSFSVDGSYKNLRNFLADLESNLRLTDIRSLNISEGTDGDSSYGLKLRTYWLGT